MMFESMTAVSLAFVMGLGGVGLPLGMPPGPEDPLMAKVAPEECTFYLSWAGLAEPDPKSTNRTEQLLAEKEVRHFIKQLDKVITTSLLSSARDNEMQKVVAAEAPKIVKAILTNPGAIFVGQVKLGFKGPQVDGGLIVNTGKQTDEIKKVLARIEAALGGQITEVEIGASTWKEFPMPEGAPRVVWGFRGKYMILGVGKDSVEGMFKRVRTDPPKWLADLRKELPVGRTSNIMYVNVKSLLQLATAVSGDPEVAAVTGALGLDNVTYLAVVNGLDETGCVSRARLAFDGKPEGIFALAGGKPLSINDLAPIPADATGALVVRLDAEKLLKDIRASVAKIDPGAARDMDRELEELQTAMGIDLSSDLFRFLGDTWRVYNSPGEGGLLFTGLTAVVPVNNPKRVAATLEQMERKIQEQVKQFKQPTRFGRTRRHATIKHVQFAGRKIYFVNFVGEQSPIAPAWCVTDNELIVSTFPSHIKSYLSRGSDFKSLATVPEVAKAFKGETGPMMLAYQDTPKLFEMVYPIVQIIGQFVCSEAQRNGVDLNISFLPSAPSIARHLRPGVTSITRTEAGIELVSRQTLPVGGGLLPMAMPMMWFMSYGRSRAFEIESAIEHDHDGAAPRDFRKGGVKLDRPQGNRVRALAIENRSVPRRKVERVPALK